MRIRIINTIVIVSAAFLFSTVTLAQNPETERLARAKTEKAQQDRTKIEQTLIESKAARELDKRLSVITSEAELRKVMSESVAAGDKTVVPYLKARLEANYFGKNDTEIALVRLGEKEYLDKTIGELSSTDDGIRSAAVWKLSMFKTREAYRKLYELLDDETVQDGKDHGDYLVPSLSRLVMEKLASSVENPPHRTHDKAEWKAWFARNKSLIE